MNHRMFLIGITAVCATALVIASWTANAQQPAVQPQERWEYSVLPFEASDDLAKAGPAFTQRLNRYAKDGWHYVGKLAEYSTTNEFEVNNSHVRTTTWVVFRRAVR